MVVPERFVQNIKVLTEKKVLTDEDLKLVMVCIQEIATMSPIELVSLLDNIEALVLEGQTELTDQQFSEIKSDLFDSLEVETSMESV
jgi:hypothetical protein